MYVCVCIRVNCNLIRSNQQWSSLLISVALAGTRRRQRVCPAVVVVCLPPADGPRQRRRSAGRRARRPRASISPRGVGVGLESPSRRIDQEAAESDGARQAGSRLGDDVDGDYGEKLRRRLRCAGRRAWSVRSAESELDRARLNSTCATTTAMLPPLRRCVYTYVQTRSYI